MPTDISDANASESVMVALLPMTTDWCQIELPHMTLVYAGLVDDLKPSSFNDLAKDTASIAMFASPLTLEVLGVEVFGDTEQVNVLRLRPSSELVAMRRLLSDWNASEYEFNPHVTVGPVGSPVQNVPMYIAFDRIMVGWGNDNLTFWLKKGY